MESRQVKASAQVIAASVIYGFAGIFFVYVRNMAEGPVVFYQLLFGLRLFISAERHVDCCGVRSAPLIL
ncbi:hypothetical protein ACSAZK_03265 [Methanosarcina sp. Mfa9]|uniref:hypothetical protein n=1 Tax=Methanosarcina sp. Mfa9 TaxID=3439063 RepID=UPI003F82DD9F